MNYRIFDIETGPVSLDKLQDQMPEFKAPSNYKDEEKIAAYIEEQQSKWIEKAALDASTGRVMAIGVKDSNGNTIIKEEHFEGEREILQWFWDEVTDTHADTTWVGFNSNNFDLPFLFRRSLVYGIQPGYSFRESRYWPARFLDLLEVWACGNREQRISLDKMARLLGVGGKNGSGKLFANLYETDRKSAIEYLKHDLDITEAIMIKMQPWIGNSK